MQHVSSVTEKLKKMNERMLPLMVPKEHFHLCSNIKTFIVLIVANLWKMMCLCSQKTVFTQEEYSCMFVYPDISGQALQHNCLLI